MPGDDDPFAVGSLTDVPGVLVGHHQRTGRGWSTGTTVISVPGGAVAAVDVRGGGPGTRETDALDPRNLVDRVHAVCLSGGSAYGLSAADGVMAVLEARGLGVPVGPRPTDVVPVVPTAVIFDLGRGGVFGNRPGPDFGRRAIERARPTAARGSVGAGTGARAGGLRGGVGMASGTVTIDGRSVRVGALAVVNASGAVIDPATGLPWRGVPGLRRPTATERAALAAALAPAPLPDPHAARPEAGPSLNTTIGLVATDADLDRPEAGRLAMAAHDGLARAVRPAHSLVDGDSVFALATGATPLPMARTGLVPADAAGRMSRALAINALLGLAADLFATACADAILTAGPGRNGLPAYRDLCPSALRAFPTAVRPTP